jgi:hypothetical protein
MDRKQNEFVLLKLDLRSHYKKVAICVNDPLIPLAHESKPLVSSAKGFVCTAKPLVHPFKPLVSSAKGFVHQSEPLVSSAKGFVS